MALLPEPDSGTLDSPCWEVSGTGFLLIIVNGERFLTGFRVGSSREYVLIEDVCAQGWYVKHHAHRELLRLQWLHEERIGGLLIINGPCTPSDVAENRMRKAWGKLKRSLENGIIVQR